MTKIEILLKKLNIGKKQATISALFVLLWVIGGCNVDNFWLFGGIALCFLFLPEQKIDEWMLKNNKNRLEEW